jgi:putative sterol carrier protein
MAAFMSGKIEVSNVMSAMGLQGALSSAGAVIKDIDTEY